MTQPSPQHGPGHRVENLPPDLRACVDGLTNAVFKGVSREVALYDLTAVQFSLLSACLDSDGETTATELAQVLPIDASRISRLVSVLVDRGLLVRRRLPDDRRVVMLSLSDEGKELTSRILQRMELHDAVLTEGIGEDEMRIFVSVASRILANYADLRKPE